MALREGDKPIQSSPMIEGNTVTFSFTGKARDVYLYGDMNDWNEHADRLSRIDGTDSFVIRKEFPEDARFDYVFLVDGEWKQDPHNPLQSVSYYRRYCSCMQMPAYRNLWRDAFRRGPLKGRLESGMIRSRAFAQDRPFRVYLPPGYQQAREYPVLYLNDGYDYIHMARAHRAAEAMILDGRIPPLILVFVEPQDRYEEYRLSPAYAGFLAEELLPHIDSRYAISPDPGRCGILGASLGGLTALHLALLHGDLFGLAGSQSGAFGFAGNRYYADDPGKFTGKKLRVYLDAGTFDNPELLGANRSLRDSLSAAGISTCYGEYHEGHSWGMWRRTLHDALLFLFG